MILTCPACDTKYVVKDNAIPPEGRKVRCASCKHSWHQDPDPSVLAAVPLAEAVEGDPLQDSNPAPAEQRQEEWPATPTPAPEAAAPPTIESRPPDPDSDFSDHEVAAEFRAIEEDSPAEVDEPQAPSADEDGANVRNWADDGSEDPDADTASDGNYAPLTSISHRSAGARFGATGWQEDEPIEEEFAEEPLQAPAFDEPGASEVIEPVEVVEAVESVDAVETVEAYDEGPAIDGWVDSDDANQYVVADPDESPRRKWPWLLAGLLLVAAAVAAFWFLAPSSWKQQAGVVAAGESPLKLMITSSDRQELESGNELVAISGRVINPTDREITVPPIKAELRNKQSKKVVHEWTIAPPANVLAPRSSAPFNSAETDVPAGGDELTVSLDG